MRIYIDGNVVAEGKSGDCEADETTVVHIGTWIREGVKL